MRATLLTVAALLAGFAMLQTGNGLQGTLLAVRAGIEGFGAIATGLVSSGFFVGMAGGSFLAPRVIALAGHTRAFAALASIASAASLVHLLAIDPVVWIAVRTLTGFCFAGLIVIVESWLNASVASGERGRLLSIYAVTGLAAGAAGQLLFATAPAGGFVHFTVISIILSLALVPVSLSRARAPMPEVHQAPPSLLRLWRTSPFGTVAMLFVGMTLGSFFGLVPLFAQRIGFDERQIALVMFAGTLGAMLLQYPLGALSDRMSRRFLVVILAAAASGLCVAVGLVEVQPLGTSLALAFAVGGLLLPAQSIVMAHVNDRAPPEALIATSGALMLMLGAGAATGPLLGGVVMNRLGDAGLLWFLAVVQGAIALFGLWRMTRRDAPDADLKTAYAPTPLQPVEGDLGERDPA